MMLVYAESVSPRDVVYQCMFCPNRHRHGSDNDMSCRDMHRTSECSVNNTALQLVVRISKRTKRYIKTQRDWTRPSRNSSSAFPKRDNATLLRQ